MSVLNKIACLQNRRDNVPNQLLARELVDRRDTEGIREMADNLRDNDRNVQSDCIKVLYEVGYIAPELIAAYVDHFVNLLGSRNNRMVWGGMLALSTVAELEPDEIYEHRDAIKQAMEAGSVITVDAGVEVLAMVASGDKKRREDLFPYLLKHLATCRPKDVPQHSEKVVIAVDGKNKAEFIELLERRLTDMTPSQAARVRKVIRQAREREPHSC
jgi:hypothetical protein